jgi:Caspase domain/WG containing repeat
MNKLFLIIWLSSIYTLIQAQDLPWRIQPSDAYKSVEPFSEDFAVVKRFTKVGNKKMLRCFYLDKQGNLSQDHYPDAYSFSNGWASVQTDDEIWKFRKPKASHKGDLIGGFEMAHNFQNGYAPVKKDGKWGFINGAIKLVIPTSYDVVRYFANNWATVKKNDQLLLVNTTGIASEQPILKNYTYINTFSEGFAVAADEKGNWGYIDTLGEEKIPIRKGRRYAGPFSEGFAAVSDGGTNLSFIDTEGKVRFEFKNGTSEEKDDDMMKKMYDLHPFSGGLAAVRKAGKWGYIDTTGKEVIPFEYHKVTRFSEGLAAVQKEPNGEWVFLNSKREVIRQGGDTPFQEAKSCTEGIAWVKTKEGWGALAMTEKLEIVWELPFKNKSLTEQMPITAQISSSRELQDFELEWNGKVIQKSAFIQKKQLEIKWSERIALQTGKNVLKLTVRNTKQQESNECVLYYQPPAPQQVQYSAIMIANNDYQSLTWEELLRQPFFDADTLAIILQQHYQFQRIFTLHDATLAQMNALFQDLTQQTDSTERILIFYAGHGYQPEKVQNGAYLVPKDARGFETATLFASARFAAYVKRMASKHILTMIDACFAGSFILDAPPIELELSRGRNNRGAVTGTKTAAASSNASVAPIPPSNQTRAACLEEEAAEKIVCREVMSSGQRVYVSNKSDFIQAVYFTLLKNKECKLSARTLFERLKAPMEVSLQRRITESSTKVLSKEEETDLKNRMELVPQVGILPNSGSNGGDFIFRKKI